MFRTDSDEDGGESVPYECSDRDCHWPTDCNGDHSCSLDVWRSRFGRYLYTREEFQYYGWSVGDGDDKTLPGEEVTSKMAGKKMMMKLTPPLLLKKSPLLMTKILCHLHLQFLITHWPT